MSNKMIDGKDLADYAVDFGRKVGVNYIEARVIKSIEESYTARNGRFLGILENSREGIGIRVLVDGGMAFGSTEQLNKKYIEKLIKSIIKMAKASKRKEPIVLSEEKIEETSWKTSVKQKFEDIVSEEKQDFLKQLDKRLKSESKKKLKGRLGFMLLYSDDKYIVTGEGAKVASQNSLITIMIMNTAKGKQGVEQRILNLGGTAGWEWIKEQNIEDFIVKDCLNLVKTAENARNVKFDKPIDIVISGEVSGIMAHENVGHPSEGDRILGREGAQAGESFYADLLKTEKLGEAILGNECVSIIDNPTISGSPGFYLYDDECVKARPRYLIKNGKLNELLLNREYASKFNTKSNAAARAITYNREPIPRMANTFFEPGNFTLEELIEDVKYGIYMNSFTEWNIDDRRFQSKYVGLEVYLIENGQLTDTQVRRPVLELTTKGILGNVDAVSKDYYAPIGYCGKGDPMQGVPVSLGGPHVRLRNIIVGGGK
ncbi:MAG: TldD/PmbA family protein [Promethearchaeota archaeon]